MHACDTLPLLDAEGRACLNPGDSGGDWGMWARVLVINRKEGWYHLVDQPVVTFSVISIYLLDTFWL